MRCYEILAQAGALNGEGEQSYECPTCSAPVTPAQVFSHAALLAKSRFMPDGSAFSQQEAVQACSAADGPCTSSKIDRLLAFLADLQQDTRSASSHGAFPFSILDSRKHSVGIR